MAWSLKIDISSLHVIQYRFLDSFFCGFRLKALKEFAEVRKASTGRNAGQHASLSIPLR
jgi:hypothetical protein